MSFPALGDAAHDPLFARKPTAATVYLHLVARLDFVAFTPVRIGDVADSLRMSPDTTGDAFRALRECGYIVRGPRELDVFTYRLSHARATQRTPPKPHSRKR